MLITEYMEHAAVHWPEKTAYADEKRNVSFREVQEESYKIASAILQKGFHHKPVAVFLDKSVECVISFVGVACSGNFYTPIDTKMPLSRIEKIMDTLYPGLIVTDRAHEDEARQFAGEAEILIYESMQTQKTDSTAVQSSLKSIVDTDVLYVMFTSGSTGIPKGAILSHRAVTDFIEWVVTCYELDETVIIGSQEPFYFSGSIFDIYVPMRVGGTTHIIPHEAFSFPAILMQFMFDHHINTIGWVPSALNMVSILGALHSPYLPELRHVQFGGEVMPMKQLNRWRKAYPNVRFVNMYGPTEAADTCTYYIVDRDFDDTESLPIGRACNNKDVFLLDQQDKLIQEPGQTGELCVRGTGLAYGYYNNPKNTRESFIQNPLQDAYSETVYRTGDLAKYNTYGELVYVSRKDFQIKHMGNRIELGEIETAASSLPGVESCACLYDTEHSKIVLFYTGEMDGHEIKQKIAALVPAYMVPNRLIQLERMPMNLNGKIDRLKLKERIEKKKGG